MTVHDSSTAPKRRVRWAVPGMAVAIGVAYLVAGIAADRVGFGVFGLALMLLVGGAFVIGGRYSETMAGLFDRRDERINDIDLRASMYAGAAVLAAVFVMFLVRIVQGQDGSPYYQLGALGGLSYVVALVVLRYRS